MKCSYCEGPNSLNNNIQSIINIIWTLFFTLFYVFLIFSGIVGFAGGGGFGIGLGIGSIWDDFDPVPWFSWVGMGVGIPIGIIVFIYYAFAKGRVYTAKYGRNALSVLIFETFSTNRYAFCCENCHRDYNSEFNAKMNEWSKEYNLKIQMEKDRIQMKKDELERIRQERIKMKKSHELKNIGNPDSIQNNISPSVYNIESKIPQVPTLVKGKSTQIDPSVPEYDLKGSEWSSIQNQPSIDAIPYSSSDPSKEENLCCICLERKSNMLYYPCKHICTCDMCPKPKYGTPCPVCRIPVESSDKVFIS